MKYKRLYKTSPYLISPKNGNAGYDLRAHLTNGTIEIGPAWTAISTGIAIEIPEGYVGLIRGRSGLFFKHNVECFHGTIDACYRGKIFVSVRCLSNYYTVLPYDRIAQLIIVPYFSEDVEIVDELSETRRGSNGFGSSGR